MFNGIHAPICRTNYLVQDGESGLERRKFDQRLDRLGIDLFCFQDLLTPAS